MLRWRISRHGAHHVKSLIVVGIERAPDVDEAVADDALEQCRALPAAGRSHVGLRSFGCTSRIGSRDVQIAADDERQRIGAHFGGEPSSAVRNCIFAGKSLPPLGT